MNRLTGRTAELDATMKDAISARKKFIAPVAVPTWNRITEFCTDTTLTGNTVPSPSADTDSSASKVHNGIATIVSTAPASTANAVPMMATRL